MELVGNNLNNNIYIKIVAVPLLVIINLSALYYTIHVMLV